jgi:hypothetical protein
LKQIDAAKSGQKSSMWGSILGAIGGVAAGALLSDMHAKEEIRPFTRGLSDLAKIEPVMYKYNGKGGVPKGTPGISVLAQQLEEAIPEAVVDGEYKAILPMGLLMTTINSVKELNKRVEALSKKGKK